MVATSKNRLLMDMAHEFDAYSVPLNDPEWIKKHNLSLDDLDHLAGQIGMALRVYLTVWRRAESGEPGDKMIAARIMNEAVGTYGVDLAVPPTEGVSKNG